MALSQQNRRLAVSTPLGKDVLVLSGFSGREEISRPFRYQLDMLSEKTDITPQSLVGKTVSWSVQYPDQEPRYFSGIISRFSAGGKLMRGTRNYRAEIVPWLWLLTRTANCRMFQNKSVPDIIKAIFDAYGFTDYQLNLKGTHSPWEYCVQYRETAFNFISRLMEQEGIFYYFKHENGKHTMILCDQKSGYADTMPGPLDSNHVFEWEHQYEFRTGKWSQTDYNFATPSTNLFTTTPTTLDLPDSSKFEMFDYPGDYEIKGDGDGLTRLRMEEDEAAFNVVTGSSDIHDLSAGVKFKLDDHDFESEAATGYVVTAIQHNAEETPYTTTTITGSYSNVFTCIPDTVTFRTPRATPKPIVSGPQTAVVVGPKGEEIYTDKYGRVKVQFFWDREGKKDENSSCWIRVAENWAGKNWGVIFNPRIGQEVIVEFLEGDPDRPIITGRVYNAEQMPPYDLPANQTQSTIKTRSSKGGGTENFNELRFEDKKGSEEIYFHAEQDFNRVVENNDTLKVGSPQAKDGSQTIEIYKDRTETIKTGNEKVTVEKGNRDVIISMGNESLSIKMGNQTTKLDLGASSTEAMQSIELKVGQSSIKIDQ
ncbi:MAG TPA: type VI secretion system tip protein VgrG, partial [Gemmataceae bacterium]|nr:type VI secretion system tip protein VgrG [Gemmataceae bacterium]